VISLLNLLKEAYDITVCVSVFSCVQVHIHAFMHVCGVGMALAHANMITTLTNFLISWHTFVILLAGTNVIALYATLPLYFLIPVNSSTNSNVVSWGASDTSNT
jgi:hypothetical protein